MTMLEGFIYNARWAVRSLLKPVRRVGEVQTACRRQRLGSGYGGWTIHPDRITRDSIVYSVGVGEDITWDLAMIRRFGCRVHAMDPTPKSIQWVKSQRLPPEFVMHEFGLGEADGELTFYPPDNPAHVSHTVIANPATAARAITVPLLRLRTILDRLGHTRLDILKMDIEGSEYGVVDDIARTGYDIDQILIEFHHRMPQIGEARTLAAIATLNKAGYKVFNIAPNSEEYSFIRA